MEYLLRGVMVGVLFGLPVGAVGALVVQRTWSGGIRAGLLTGLGSSAADCCYAAVGMLLALMTACTSASDEPKVNPDVNNGVVDESYVGNPSPVLEENYHQSPAEEKVQQDVLDKLKDQEDSEEGPTIHGI